MHRPSTLIPGTVVVCGLLCAVTARGQAPDWPDLYDPFRLLDLQVTMDPGDLAIIKADTTFDIEKPAWFGVPGEEPLLVSIRRKSADPIGDKVSFKIDVNEYVDPQKWHGVQKLSLENGDDQDVVSEGLAWHFHRQAAGRNSNYTSSLANWATLTINGQCEGLYLNVEQVDKTFLRNHSLYATRATWLYKQSDISHPRLQNEPNDPAAVNTTMEALNYSPFVNDGAVPTPDNAALARQLPGLIEMDVMLTLGALDSFVGNPDSMFSHGKNFYWADYVEGKRRYLAWDLDATIRRTNLPIYETSDEYGQVLLGHPMFRNQYNQILLDLLDGPLRPEEIIAFLDELEPILTPALAADPDNNIGEDVAGHFEDLRNWIVRRAEFARDEVLLDVPLFGDANLDGIVDGEDFRILQSHFGQAGEWGEGDFNGDYVVNFRDYLVWKSQLGETGGSAPEPTTLSLLMLGGLGVWLRRRRT
jgi:spore coat protein CotH